MGLAWEEFENIWHAGMRRIGPTAVAGLIRFIKGCWLKIEGVVPCWSYFSLRANAVMHVEMQSAMIAALAKGLVGLSVASGLVKGSFLMQLVSALTFEKGNLHCEEEPGSEKCRLECVSQNRSLEVPDSQIPENSSAPLTLWYPFAGMMSQIETRDSQGLELLRTC